ncbi:glycosyltransferase family 2 protein [Bacillus sp. CLL-7-23]|uniref:Glycosyltransferase family 2 protein n=1 Tax=Bacillus changyiensis TaxID=3004103 RepID=A0ABT4WZ42_9BACI|nr:glycosyltransferase family 2 protein [Bacillus changyiensis]MDA7025316.1 glycosyltransferase family 2 protein [Bacillus changyiensis]
MRISIVIVTHNRIPALCELLESIVKQSIKPYEVIIVNDAGERIDSVQSLYSDLPIKVIDLAENVKHVKARNIGVKEATGDVIMLSDDDDFFTPCHMERMANAMKAADLVYSDAEIVSFKMKDETRIPISRRLFAYALDLEEMRRFSTYIPSGSMYKRSLHREIGYFDPGVHHYWDWDFFLRTAASFQVKRVPVASVIYAFSNQGDNQSSNLSKKRQYYLNILSEKHQLGSLPVKNFFVLLDESELRKRQAVSEIVWDGKPVISRFSNVTF